MDTDHLEHFPWAAQFEGLGKLEFDIRKTEKIRVFVNEIVELYVHWEYTRATGYIWLSNSDFVPL